MNPPSQMPTMLFSWMGMLLIPNKIPLRKYQAFKKEEYILFVSDMTQHNGSKLCDTNKLINSTATSQTTFH